jgi:hypothetical protein
MQYTHVPEPEASLQAQPKPHLNSYDSCQECSLAHFLEVCRLVEMAEREDCKPKRNAFDDSLSLVSD